MLSYSDIVNKNKNSKIIYNINEVKKDKFYVFNIFVMDKDITEPIFLFEFDCFANAYKHFLNKIELFKNFKSNVNIENFKLASGKEVLHYYFNKESA